MIAFLSRQFVHAIQSLCWLPACSDRTDKYLFRNTASCEYLIWYEACLYEHKLLALFQQIWAGIVNL